MPEIVINGVEGRLEARYFHNKEEGAPVAVVLHPHPEFGGDMNNKVTYALYRAFCEEGFSVMRFNFRGVGKSEGRFDQGEGELTDTASAVDWLQTYNPSASACWVAGFSFGAWIAMQLLMRRPEIDGFISISPPANMYDFSFLAPCPVAGKIIQGTKDDIVPKDCVDSLVQKLKAQTSVPIEYETVEGADHFYTNRLSAMIDSARKHLRANKTTEPKDQKMVWG